MENYNTLSTSAQDKVLALGLTAVQWVELLKNGKAVTARRALNYFDGQQEEELIKVLNDVNKGRKKWQERGIIPRFRNVTRSIVEKSGMLFKDAVPVLEVFRKDQQTPDEAQTSWLNEEFAKMEWQEFFINFDAVVRLLKTGVLLVQHDPVSQQLVFDILHRANCSVVMNLQTKAIDGLIYQTSDDGEMACYRVITSETFIDLCSEKNQISITGVFPNPYDIVPAVPFYDTTTPRSGFWVEASHDLVGLNELVNLHLTDSEYAISWAKLPTLFTNCRFEDSGTAEFEEQFVGTNPLPMRVPATASVIGGPSRAIFLDSSGVDSPFIEYKGPKVDIEPLDRVIDGWIKGYANDWSVRVKTAGEGSASSGFQLVVEEMDNLDLRKQRQKMFAGGFKRMFGVLKIVCNTYAPGVFSDDAELFATFPDPILPVETKEQEEVWSLKIAEGRATVIDYFMEVKGVTKDEAILMYEEIQLWNATHGDQSTTLTALVEPTVSGEEVDSSGDEPLTD